MVQFLKDGRNNYHTLKSAVRLCTGRDYQLVVPRIGRKPSSNNPVGKFAGYEPYHKIATDINNTGVCKMNYHLL